MRKDTRKGKDTIHEELQRILGGESERFITCIPEWKKSIVDFREVLTKNHRNIFNLHTSTCRCRRRMKNTEGGFLKTRSRKCPGVTVRMKVASMSNDGEYYAKQAVLDPDPDLNLVLDPNHDLTKVRAPKAMSIDWD